MLWNMPGVKTPAATTPAPGAAPAADPEDRRIITEFFDRLRQAQVQRDPGNEALITELMDRHPETRYAVVQMAYVLEHTLAEAQNRIRELEHQQKQKSGGFLGGMLGGRSAPPQPVHAPGYRPGMFQNRGGGFLGTAASVALGVVGGMMLGSMLSSMMGMDEAAAAEPEPEPTEEPAAAEETWGDGGFDEGEEF